MEVVILILIILSGIWIIIEDFKDREVTAILCYIHLALLSFYMYFVNYHSSIFIAVLILTILITQFGKEQPKVNYIDIFYAIFALFVIKYSIKDGLSPFKLLPLIIGYGSYILIKDKEKVPMVGICSTIISLSLII